MKKKQLTYLNSTRTALLLSLWLGVLATANQAQAFYASEFGRWINRDPVQEQGGYNLYCNSGQDLINRVDPVGLIYFITPPVLDPILDNPPDPKKTHIECGWCSKPCGGPIVLHYIGCFMRRPNDEPMNRKAFEECMKQPAEDLMAACQDFDVAALRSANRRAKICYDHHW